MNKYAEQEAFKPRVPLQDPDIRNGLRSPRLKTQTELQDTQVTTWNNIQGNPSDNSELLALLENFEAALGYTPLNPSNNLSELTDIEQAIINLGLFVGGSYDMWLARTGGTMEGQIVLALTAALQFQANDSLPAGTKGFLDFDGEHLLFTQGEQRRPFLFLSDTITTSQNVNTTTETEIWTADLDPNTLAVGSFFEADIFGKYSNTDGTSTFTLRFKVAGVTILSIVSTAAIVTNQPVMAKFINTVRSIGASGSFWPYVEAKINNVNKDKPGTGVGAIDTESTQPVSITIQWSATDAGNTFSLDQALLRMN